LKITTSLVIILKTIIYATNLKLLPRLFVVIHLFILTIIFWLSLWLTVWGSVTHNHNEYHLWFTDTW